MKKYRLQSYKWLKAIYDAALRVTFFWLQQGYKVVTKTFSFLLRLQKLQEVTKWLQCRPLNIRAVIGCNFVTYIKLLL
jgi:hypothetical protein